MAYTPITPITPIDFTNEELDIGDTVEFLVKMNSQMAKLQAWTTLFATAIASINTRGAELEATQLADLAAIATFQSQLDALQLTIDSYVAGVASLQSEVDVFETAVGTEVADYKSYSDTEIAALTAKVLTAQGKIDGYKVTLDALIAAENLDAAGLIALSDTLASIIDSAGELSMGAIPSLLDNLPSPRWDTMSESQKLERPVGRAVLGSDGVVYEKTANAVSSSALPAAADSAARDLITGMKHGDWTVVITPRSAHYWNTIPTTALWVDTSSSLIPTVPANGKLDPTTGVTSWMSLPPVSRVYVLDPTMFLTGDRRDLITINVSNAIGSFPGTNPRNLVNGNATADANNSWSPIANDIPVTGETIEIVFTTFRGSLRGFKEIGSQGSFGGTWKVEGVLAGKKTLLIATVTPTVQYEWVWTSKEAFDSILLTGLSGVTNYDYYNVEWEFLAHP